MKIREWAEWDPEVGGFRTAHGGPARPNDAWGPFVITPPRRCRWWRPRHRTFPDPSFPTYDVCSRCGRRWPRPIRVRPVVDGSGGVGENRGR